MKKISEKQKKELEQFIQISTKKQEALRAQALLLLEEKGMQKKLSLFTGYSRAQAFRIKRKFFSEGISSLHDKRKTEPQALLTKQQREEIIETVKTKTPKDFGYEREHWTTGILGDWIDRNYRVKYKSKTSLYLLFRRAKFTYHKPGRVYDRHDEKEVETWKTETKPKLDQFLKEENTVILTEDEMVLTTETTIQKVWLPEGEFPKIVCTTGGRKRRSLYGVLNMKTGEEHAFKTEFQNMYVTAEILERVREIYPKQKIALFWDNAGWHRGSVVQEWIKKDGNIEVVHFPRYAPEENPQEHVWKSGRSAVTHNEYIENIDTATDKLVAYFNGSRFRYSLLGVSLIS
jgi:transposase